MFLRDGTYGQSSLFMGHWRINHWAVFGHILSSPPRSLSDRSIVVDRSSLYSPAKFQYVVAGHITKEMFQKLVHRWVPRLSHLEKGESRNILACPFQERERQGCGKLCDAIQAQLSKAWCECSRERIHHGVVKVIFVLQIYHTKNLLRFQFLTARLLFYMTMK